VTAGDAGRGAAVVRVDHLAQHLLQRGRAVGAEGGQHALFVRACLTHQRGGQRLAGGRSAHQRQAAVRRVGEPFDQALGHQPVELTRDGGLRRDDDLRQLSHRQRLAAGQAGQDAPFGHRHAGLARHPVELGRDQVAGLRQQRGQVAVDEAAGRSFSARHLMLLLLTYANAWG
jgi:hypothetical protein